MKYRRTLLKTLAILGPLALALSAGSAEPAYANYWCGGYYYDPNCAYPYAYPYPYGGFFFFRDDRRFHRFDHRFDHHFDHPFDHPFHGGFNHGGFGHGGFNHGGFGHGGFGGRMFSPGGGHGR
jgi:hypothetical protein